MSPGPSRPSSGGGAQVSEREPFASISDPRVTVLSSGNPYPVSIRYRAADNALTDREVMVRLHVSFEGHEYLLGLDRLRGADRHFRIDRIVWAFDGLTGEEIRDVSFWAQACL